MRFKRLGPGWYLSEDRRVELRREVKAAGGGIRFWEVWVDGKKVGDGETKEEAVASLGRLLGQVEEKAAGPDPMPAE
jgi:hypothetical protein